MPREQNSDREGISVGDFVRLLWSQYLERTVAGQEGTPGTPLDSGKRRDLEGQQEAPPGSGNRRDLEGDPEAPPDSGKRGDLKGTPEALLDDGQPEDLAGNLDALLDYGKRRGWVEAQDILESGKPLLRRQAARILHEFIRKECREADEEDWGAARELADLYDCRVCANHVAQVYVKGIMEALSVGKSGEGSGGESQERSGGEFRGEEDAVKYFGMAEKVLPLEAGRITARALDRSRRQPAPPSSETEGKPCGIRITPEEARRLCRKDPMYAFWDVRSREEYEREPLRGAVNVPMMEILDAPERWAGIPKSGVILGCDGGYRSQVAADCLARAGCENVYYLGWDT